MKKYDLGQSCNGHKTAFGVTGMLLPLFLKALICTMFQIKFLKAQFAYDHKDAY